jgi:hypothetical protein
MPHNPLQAPAVVRRLLDRPVIQFIAWLLLFDLVVLSLSLTLGRPLGDLKREPFTPIWVLHIAFSSEVIYTPVSALHLLLCAWVVHDIYVIRRKQQLPPERGPGAARLWLLMGIGFACLALDELLCIHEGIDKLIHWLARLRESPWSDRLDDVILLAYAVIGLTVLLCYRKEVAKFKGFWPLVVLGGFLGLASISLDMLTNRKDVMYWLLGNKQQAEFWWAKLCALEEGFESLAEATFVGLFLRCRELARQLEVPQSEPMPDESRRAA